MTMTIGEMARKTPIEAAECGAVLRVLGSVQGRLIVDATMPKGNYLGSWLVSADEATVIADWCEDHGSDTAALNLRLAVARLGS